MKTTIVPAQITTVEDKIAGNLNITQIMLLIGALLVSTCIYVLLPTPMKFSILKLTLISIISLMLISLAVRIKGKVLLNWIMIIATYSLRPQYFVFDKDNIFGRDIITPEIPKNVAKVKAKEMKRQNTKQPLTTDLVALEGLLRGNLRMRFAFNRKGGARVIFNKN